MMKKLLDNLSEKAIQLGEFEFSPEQAQLKWLGNIPAEEAAIKSAEKKLGISLPSDYKHFLSLTNGFTAAMGTEPSFLPVEEIDFLKNIDKDIIEAYNQEGIEEIAKHLARSIVIAGKDEEQYFLLIPPTENTSVWTYWKFANWIPGEEQYKNLDHYWKEVLVFVEETLDEDDY